MQNSVPKFDSLKHLFFRCGEYSLVSLHYFLVTKFLNENAEDVSWSSYGVRVAHTTRIEYRIECSDW